MEKSVNQQLGSFASTVWRYRWLVLAIVGLCLSVFLAHYKYRGSYSAKGILLIQKAQNSTIQEVSAGLGRVSSGGFAPFSKDLYTEKFIMYLNSRDFYLEVADLLVKNPEKFRKLYRDETRAAKVLVDARALATDVSRMVRINRSGSLGIELVVKAPYPEAAVALTELVMETANTFIVTRELMELNAAKDYLKTNLAEIESGLNELFLKQVSEIRKNPKIQEASKSIFLEKISRITVELEKFKAEADANIRLIEKLRSFAEQATKDLLAGRKAPENKSLSAAMKAHLSALIDKRVGYLEGGVSPTSSIVIGLDAEIVRARNELAEAISNEGSAPRRLSLAGGAPIDNQIRDLEQNNFIVTQKIASLQASLRDLLRDGIQHAEYEQGSSDLLRRAEIQYSLFAELTKQLFAIDVQRISIQNKVMQIERPSIETVERRPGLMLSIFLGLVLALSMLSVILLHLDRSDPIIKSDRDVQSVGVKLLGMVPPVKSARFSGRLDSLAINHQEDSSSSIVFKNIRSKILSRHGGESVSAKVFLVTSSRTEEGKSFFSLNIARSLAAAGVRTLVIDTDSRKQGLTKAVRKYGVPGLSEFLRGDLEMSPAVCREGENLSILAAGAFNQNISELLLTKRMKDLIAFARENYDFVIVDSAPILVVGDALHLLEHADEALVVARANLTRMYELVRTLEQIEESGVPKQIVLNMSGALATYYYGHRNIPGRKPSTTQAA